MSNIKKNFIYSSILTVSNYLFPLFTYPYVSRVLGVSNIGVCNFVDSIIHYFILFSTLGVVSVGIREIASTKLDNNKLNTTFSNLVAFSGVTTLMALVLLIVAMYTVPQFCAYRNLMWIGVIKLVGNFLLVEWLFKGLEDFKYITNRTILVKFLYVVSVFVFVRNINDYDVYFLLTALMIVANAVFNIWYSRKFVRFSFEGIKLGSYAKPIIVLGLYAILTSMYTTFNVTYLGFVSTNEEVGYYSTATKLHTIIIALYTAFTGVMMPRMSSLLSEGNKEGFSRMVNKSNNILLTIAMPILLLCIIFSPDIVYLLAGPGYEGAYMPTRLIMPLILVIGFNQINIVQIMTPLKAEKFIFRNSVMGASVGLAMNFTIVSTMGAIGSSIVWICSELVVMTSSFLCVRKLTGIGLPIQPLFKNVMAFIPAIVFCVLIYIYVDFIPVLRLSLATLFVGIYTLFIQKFFLKNETFLKIVESIVCKINKKHL